jgi:light-harvesting complex 1 beta chain
MNILTQNNRDIAGPSAREDRKAFVAIFVLAIALAGQVMGCSWRTWLPGAEGAKSITGGVKAAVYTFMSHLQ